MTEIHYGTKQILATAMTRQAYNDYRGWTLPADEDGNDPGYLVEYVDGGASNHPDHAGYISWSPKDVFDRAYKASGQMNFGHAIEAMKSGAKVARSGWNGKGMWLALQVGSTISIDQARGGAAMMRARELTTRDDIEILPHIDMRAADGSIVVGWLASQTDMLADHWAIV